LKTAALRPPRISGRYRGTVIANFSWGGPGGEAPNPPPTGPIAWEAPECVSAPAPEHAGLSAGPQTKLAQVGGACGGGKGAGR
jgi:hypothetical protein